MVGCLLCLLRKLLVAFIPVDVQQRRRNSETEMVYPEGAMVVGPKGLLAQL